MDIKDFNLQDFINMDKEEAMKSFEAVLDTARQKEKENAYNAKRAEDARNLVCDIADFIQKYFCDCIPDEDEFNEAIEEFCDLSDEEITEMCEQIGGYVKALKNFNAAFDFNNNGKHINFEIKNIADNANIYKNNVKNNENFKSSFNTAEQPIQKMFTDATKSATFKATPVEDPMKILHDFFDKID